MCGILCGITAATISDPSRAATGIARSDREWLVGVAAGAVPVAAVLAFDPAGWFPFTVAKWWAVVVVSLLSCAAAIATPGRRRHVGQIGRAANVLVATLIGVVVLSAVWAIDGSYAWIGTPVRHLGALTWVLFGAMYMVGWRVATDGRTRGLAISGFVVAGVLLGVYCLVELLFGPPVEFVSNSSRLGGPFGSAAYLGAACCLLGPASIGAACDASTTRVGRLTAGTAAILLAVALVGSGARGALVGAVVAAVVVVAARPNLVPRRGRRRRPVVAAAVAASAVVAVGAMAIVAGIYERSAGWGSRLDEWRVAAHTVADRPLLGVGPEGYRIVVGTALDADYVRRYGEAVAIDRAHSGFLDVAVTSGIAAAAVYMATMIVLAWTAVRVIRGGNTLDAGVGAAVIAYVGQQQFLFPIAELDPSFWLIAGIVVARSAHLRSSEPSQPGDGARPAGASRLVAAAAVVALAAICAVVGVRAVAADRLSKDALDALAARDVGSSIERAERATELAPLDLRHHIVLARVHEGERSLGGVDRALASIDDALGVSSREPTALVERARLLALRAAITGEQDDRRSAASAWDALLVDAPMCAACHVGAAETALERGDLDAARHHLQIAADLGEPSAGARLGKLDVKG